MSFLIKLQANPCIVIKKETLAQVPSCEFCEIFKSTYFVDHLGTTASIRFKDIFRTLSNIYMKELFSKIVNNVYLCFTAAACIFQYDHEYMLSRHIPVFQRVIVWAPLQQGRGVDFAWFSQKESSGFSKKKMEKKLIKN